MKHEVIIHENTGATKTAVPYLGTYVSKETIKLAGFAAAIAEKCGLPAIQVQAILSGAFNEIESLEKESLVRVHLDGFTVCGVIKGSFDSSDADFNPVKNSLQLVLRLDDEIKLELADETGNIVTDETITKVRVDNVVDIAEPRPSNVIHGQNGFRVQGLNLVTTDDGAGIYLENSLGASFPCTVDEAISKQLVRAHSSTLLPGGDYKLHVKSRGGDAEGPLQNSFRKVKYLHVLPSLPTITKGYPVDDPTRIGICVLFKDFVLEGTNLADVTLKLKYSTDGTVIIESTLDLAKCTRTANKITIGQEAISSYLEMAHVAVKPVIVATNAAGSANYEFESAGS